MYDLSVQDIKLVDKSMKASSLMTSNASYIIFHNVLKILDKIRISINRINIRKIAYTFVPIF